MDLFKFEGMQKSKDIADYKPLETKQILKVNIGTGKVEVNKIKNLDDRFGVIDDETKED